MRERTGAKSGDRWWQPAAADPVSLFSRPGIGLAIFFSLRRVLRLGLRIADSFGQHLAQLSLRLRSLAREGFLPLGHEHYVGMPEGELKPRGDCLRYFSLDFEASLAKRSAFNRS